MNKLYEQEDQEHVNWNMCTLPLKFRHYNSTENALNR